MASSSGSSAWSGDRNARPLPKAQAPIQLCLPYKNRAAEEGESADVEDALRDAMSQLQFLPLNSSLLRSRRRDAIARSGPIQPNSTKPPPRRDSTYKRSGSRMPGDRATTR